jgi:zinc transporter, ZIP family
MQTSQGILVFALYPAMAVLAGSAVALWRPMKPALISGLQHFAAGVLFCVVATELLPELMHRKMPWVTLLGFSLGFIAMLAIKHFAEQAGQKDESQGSQSTSLIVISGVDIALDGLLIGVGFVAGQKQGLLLTIALSLELLFLGLSVAVALHASGMKYTRVLLTMLGFALLLLAGTWAGATLLIGASNTLVDAVLAFALAALLYLVTEELLVEAHEVPETSTQTAMFFVGFILLLMIEMFI